MNLMYIQIDGYMHTVYVTAWIYTYHILRMTNARANNSGSEFESA